MSMHVNDSQDFHAETTFSCEKQKVREVKEVFLTANICR